MLYLWESSKSWFDGMSPQNCFVFAFARYPWLLPAYNQYLCYFLSLRLCKSQIYGWYSPMVMNSQERFLCHFKPRPMLVHLPVAFLFGWETYFSVHPFTESWFYVGSSALCSCLIWVECQVSCFCLAIKSTSAAQEDMPQ